MQFCTPQNIGKTNTLDSFVQDFIVELKKKIALGTDKHFKKVQSKIYNVMGTLTILLGELHNIQNNRG